MSEYLSKTLPLFVMPLGIASFFAVLALVFLTRRRKRLAMLFLIIGLVVLWAAAMPAVSTSLYRSLEASHPPTPIEQVPRADCLVVLGGVLEDAAPPRVDTEMNAAVDRVHKAAELFRTGKAPVVIVSAGNQPWSRSDKSEAELIKRLLVEWGVDKDAIFVEGSSRNTRENALYSKNLVQAVNCQKPLLVTSAAHMPRAMGAFEAVGIIVTPVSTDIKVADSNDLTVMDFIPNAGSLAMTSEALREWMGRVVYKARGWA